MKRGLSVIKSEGTVQEQHVQVRVQVQGRAEALDQGHRAPEATVNQERPESGSSVLEYGKLLSSPNTFRQIVVSPEWHVFFPGCYRLESCR